jgi:DNA mismatch repair protein MLH3
MAESRIPSVKVPPPIPSDDVFFQNDTHACHVQKSLLLDRFKLANFDSCHETAIHRFTKADIRQAEIINQVDRKFIACRIPKDADTTSKSNYPAKEAQPNSMLVLIDQHAADERVRVEFFLKELLMGFLHSQDQTDANHARGIRIRELKPPRPVLLTQHEALAINRSQDTREMLRQWGVRFTESPTHFDIALESGSTGYSQLLVCSIPEVVSDKVCSALLLCLSYGC